VRIVAVTAMAGIQCGYISTALAPPPVAIRLLFEAKQAGVGESIGQSQVLSQGSAEAERLLSAVLDAPAEFEASAAHRDLQFEEETMPPQAPRGTRIGELEANANLLFILLDPGQAPVEGACQIIRIGLREDQRQTAAGQFRLVQEQPLAAVGRNPGSQLGALQIDLGTGAVSGCHDQLWQTTVAGQ